MRDFVDSATELRARLAEAVRSLPAESESVTVVTGAMAATTLAGALQAVGAAGRMRLLAVPNRFFGGNVSVAGLLTGADIAEAVRADGQSGIYLVPDVVLNADGITLDGLSTADLIAAQSRRPASGILGRRRTAGRDRGSGPIFRRREGVTRSWRCP